MLIQLSRKHVKDDKTEIGQRRLDNEDEVLKECRSGVESHDGLRIRSKNCLPESLSAPCANQQIAWEFPIRLVVVAFPALFAFHIAVLFSLRETQTRSWRPAWFDWNGNARNSLQPTVFLSSLSSFHWKRAGNFAAGYFYHSVIAASMSKTTCQFEGSCVNTGTKLKICHCYPQN